MGFRIPAKGWRAAPTLEMANEPPTKDAEPKRGSEPLD